MVLFALASSAASARSPVSTFQKSLEPIIGFLWHTEKSEAGTCQSFDMLSGYTTSGWAAACQTTIFEQAHIIGGLPLRVPVVFRRLTQHLPCTLLVKATSQLATKRTATMRRSPRNAVLQLLKSCHL